MLVLLIVSVAGLLVAMGVLVVDMVVVAAVVVAQADVGVGTDVVDVLVVIVDVEGVRVVDSVAMVGMRVEDVEAPVAQAPLDGIPHLVIADQAFLELVFRTIQQANNSLASLPCTTSRAESALLSLPQSKQSLDAMFSRLGVRYMPSLVNRSSLTLW